MSSKTFLSTMNIPFPKRDVIAISDFSKAEILSILDQAKSLKAHPQPSLLRGSILASCFFEPSTRTRLSFESAMHRLGGSVVGFSDGGMTSVKKKERLSDTMKMMEHYADVIILRHPLEGAAQQAADAVNIPVINAGDGSNQHPTQTLLDLFTIQETQGKIEGLNVALVGDLKHGRTVHSLAQACAHFPLRLYFVAPHLLEMPKEICGELREKGIKFSFHQTLEGIIEKLDILYMTRIQEERFAHRWEYEQVKNTFLLKKDHLKNLKPTCKILHPLPRVDEIDPDVDSSPHAHYFSQAQNGLFVRGALLGLLLGKITQI